jgi:hypothetical protein
MSAEASFELICCKPSEPLRSNRPAEVGVNNVMTEPTTSETIIRLLEQAARARRLAIAISGDPAAPRLEQIAAELEATIVRLSWID